MGPFSIKNLLKTNIQTLPDVVNLVGIVAVVVVVVVNFVVVVGGLVVVNFVVVVGGFVVVNFVVVGVVGLVLGGVGEPPLKKETKISEKSSIMLQNNLVYFNVKELPK